jgi:NTP pyrophosphatase (non-canonical NTP hydrolase)
MTDSDWRVVSTTTPTFDEYQQQAASTAVFTNDFYPIASLMVESAELADLFVKPMLRGDDTHQDNAKIVSEAGDVLWNLAVLLHGCNIRFSEVVDYNVAKLQDRQRRGVLKGNGGNR